MARIFLSYARADSEDAAETLRDDLQLAGHLVWRDREEMYAGKYWRDQIREAVIKADCLIVLLTPASVASENVAFEWQTAFALEKPVIGVKIIDCEVPKELSDLHYHMVTDEESYVKMLLLLTRDLNKLEAELAQQRPFTEDVTEEARHFVQSAIRAYRQQLRQLRERGEANIPDEPYKELLYFELSDARIFFGRDFDARDLKRKISRNRLAVLHARSGAGKTSLVNAGLMPTLIRDGYVPIYARVARTDPVEAIKSTVAKALSQKVPPELQQLSLHQFLRLAEEALGEAEKGIVVILDQFEEFFVVYPQSEQRQPFIDAIADCYEDVTLRTHFLLSLRKDYFSDLGEFQERLPSIYVNEYRLPIMSRFQAQDAIVQPVQMVDESVSYNELLLNELLDDLETSGMELPHLQIICSQLYGSRANGQLEITLADYERNGRATGILGGYLNRTLETFPAAERRIADDILFELVSSQSTKRILERERLIEAVRAPEEIIEKVLRKLVDARLLRRDIETEEGKALYEMAHEYLVEEILRRASTDPAKIALKQARELLQGAVNSWNQGILMSRAMLERIYQERENLGHLSDAELTCVLVSAIQENYEVRYWMTHDAQRALPLMHIFVIDERQPMHRRLKILVSFQYLEALAEPFLLQLLEHPAEPLQKRAAQVLERFGSPEAKSVAQAAYNKVVELEDKRRQQIKIEHNVAEEGRVLGLISEITHYNLSFEKLLDYLGDQDARVKSASIDKLRKYSLTTEQLKIFLVRTTDTNGIRDAALRIIPELPDNWIYEQVVEYLIRPPKLAVMGVMREILIKAGNLAVPTLQRTLAANRNAAIQNKIREILQAINTPVSKKALQKDNLGSPPRQPAVAPPAKLPSTSAAISGSKNPLELLKSSFIDDREKAIRLLRQQGDDAAIEAISGALIDRSYHVTTLAARTLGELRNPKAIPLLTRALEDPDGSLRHAAFEALKMLVDYTEWEQYDFIRQVWTFIWSAANDYPAAADELVSLGDEAVPYMKAALTRQHEYQRRRIFAVLKKINTPDALEVLEEWQKNQK